MLIITIDIGTNTLLMNISKIVGDKIIVLEDIQRIARLGFNVDKSKNINDEAIKRAEIILLEYRKIIDNYISDKKNQIEESEYKIKVIGTSALRDAENKKYVIDKLEQVILNKIQIISGEEEAKLSFIGTLEDNLPSFVLDIGGGSTELIYGYNKEIIFRQSIDIGAVRITERFLKTSPPNEIDLINAKKFVKSELETLKLEFIDFIQKSNINLIGEINPIVVAGTATSMASIIQKIEEFDYSVIHNTKYAKNIVGEKLNLISKLTRQQINNELFVPEQRADILLGGAIILYEFLNTFELDHFICSCKGLRYGPLMQEYNKKQNQV